MESHMKYAMLHFHLRCGKYDCQKKISWFFLIYTTVLASFVVFNQAHISEIVMGTGKQKD